jgi:hypothetical protein
MGKIILEFDIIEELHDAQVALDGHKWKLAMWDLDQILRSTVKYSVSITNESKAASSEEMDVADKTREKIREILNNYNLNLED